MNIWTERNWKPMLLKEVNKPFNSKDYIFELKYDGIRTICFVNNKNIEFRSRNNHNLTHLFPELISIKKLAHNNIIFDGEIVAFNKRLPSFSKIQERLHIKSKKKIQILSKTNPVIFVVFDILYEKKDLTKLSLLERKEVLNKYSDTDVFIKAKYVDTKGIQFFNSIKQKNLEGMVAKLKKSPYSINKRTSDFIKIKNIKRDEFIICGYKENKVNLSLYLSKIKNNKYIYVGKCSLSKNNNIYIKIINTKKVKSYLKDITENITFIKPSISCYIEYTEITKNGHLRHPVFKGEHNEI